MSIYRSVFARLGGIVNPGGVAFVRTPREQVGYEEVRKLVEETFEGQDVCIHHVSIQTELGAREGKGVAIVFAAIEPSVFSIEPVRAVELALVQRSIVV